MTPRFGLPYIAADQAQKHVTHNAALDDLDALLPGVVVSATTAAPPGSPVEGEAYIVPPGGAFGAAGPGDLAIYRGGSWKAITPAFGWRYLVADEGGERVFAGSAGWLRGAVPGAVTGAALGLAVRDAVLDLIGPSVTASGLIPTRAIVLGVTSWTVEVVTGATGYQVGNGVGQSQFGGTLGLAAGSSNVGVVGPFATYAPTDVVVTAEGADFTGGKVGVAALLVLPSAAPI